jgi:hypothetical protein
MCGATVEKGQRPDVHTAFGRILAKVIASGCSFGLPCCGKSLSVRATQGRLREFLAASRRALIAMGRTLAGVLFGRMGRRPFEVAGACLTYAKTSVVAPYDRSSLLERRPPVDGGPGPASSTGRPPPTSSSFNPGGPE